MVDIQKLKDEFISLYGSNGEPEVYFAPGRVNLIGEHTDYNGGYVFPCALNYGTYLVVRPNTTRIIRFASTNFDFKTEVPLDKISEKVDSQWVNYPLGVMNELVDQGMNMEGIDLLFSGDIPNGAGLSSSASIEMVTAYALNYIFKVKLSVLDLVKISQRAENEFVGMNCGIMDQFAVGMGKKDHAVFLNCDTLEYDLVPLVLQDYRLIITNTNKKRKLTDSKYNERRAECEKAVAYINRKRSIRNLGELSLAEFEQLQDLIPDETILKRAYHVVSEDARVLEAVHALKTGDLVRFGKLMFESHDSLRDNYEVTGFELDTLVEEARKIPGVIGSRMTGAGFGGCTVSLVKKDMTGPFMEQLEKAYIQKTGLNPDFYLAEVGDGAKKI
ncbi:MAG TPA: galactokinase [Bacteroidetes bacterium]|nr:galactokinase [Bacteroidota bacterium]